MIGTRERRVRAVLFRVMAAGLAVAFAAVLVPGVAPDVALEKRVRDGVSAVGFGLSAVLGTGHGERLMLAALGGHWQ